MLLIKNLSSSLNERVDREAVSMFSNSIPSDSHDLPQFFLKAIRWAGAVV
jgi:hypothetical protein